MDRIDRIITATTRTIADTLTVVVLFLSVQKEHAIRAIDVNNTHYTESIRWFVRLFVSHNIWIVHYLFYNCVLENFFHREHTQTRCTDGTYVVDCDVRDGTGDMTLWYPRDHIIRKGTKGGITKNKKNKKPRNNERRSATTSKTGSNESSILKNQEQQKQHLKTMIWLS